ncbi:hypothetical protein pEaSNUABM30_00259 [Erwinia phage pEa_SNUABM_30]|uniref:Uncharacterized protein n=1 Tax=Erwinia phage pEa_SNUABM_30 TaxID=2869553 RepID=A0AAE8XL11_9CAUD|nr:hypothetical protein MPK69_gp259 [Erwinia phage pEa_SNUABM_30]UAW53377.1 hypothetical protein pEaSNUABM30_00259 [Erwinia phage pEa_SNUABM_30]
MKQYPQRYRVYTLKEIETELELRDSPFLQFTPQKVRYVGLEPTQQVIQQSNIAGPLSDIEGWADTEWTYLYETEEWIPIFVAVNNAPVEALCVIEPDTSEFRTDGTMFVYPKGTECKQYVPYDEAVHGDLLERDE